MNSGLLTTHSKPQSNIWEIHSKSGFHTHPIGLSVIQSTGFIQDFIPLTGPYVVPNLESELVSEHIFELQKKIEHSEKKCVMWGSLKEQPSRNTICLNSIGIDHEWMPNWGLRTSLLLDHYNHQKAFQRKYLLMEWVKVSNDTLLHIGGWKFQYPSSEILKKDPIKQYATLEKEAIISSSPDSWSPVGLSALSAIGDSVRHLL